MRQAEQQPPAAGWQARSFVKSSAMVSVATPGLQACGPGGSKTAPGSGARARSPPSEEGGEGPVDQVAVQDGGVRRDVQQAELQQQEAGW